VALCPPQINILNVANKNNASQNESSRSHNEILSIRADPLITREGVGLGHPPDASNDCHRLALGSGSRPRANLI
jgi:hypothetical protein